MKNRIHLSLLLTAALVFLSACVKDELYTSCRDDQGGFQLMLSIGDPEDVAITRSVTSSSECTISDLYLLVFDASTGFYKFGEMVVISNSILINNGSATPTLTSNLMVKTGDKVVVLANTGQTVTTVPLVVGVSTVADINTAFPSGDVLGVTPAKIWTLTPSGSGHSRPMSGEFVCTSSSQVQTCNLHGSVAKINVVLDPDIQDATGIFATSNIWFTIVNSANYGHIYASEGAMSIPTSGMTFGTYAQRVEVPSYSGPGTGLGGPLLSRYIPEYNSSVRAKNIPVSKTEFHKDRMCIIVHVNIDKASTNLMYYRLDIATGNTDAETKEFLDIVRNKHYMVTIKKVKSAGYTSVEEALSLPGSNLEYEIKATGDDDNIIVSNGQYALSLDYDEVIYAGDATTEVSFGQICGIDVVGTGLPTTNSITVSSGVTLTSATSVSTTKQELKAKMNGTTGTITVKLGNIVREIKLIRNNIIIPASGNDITITGDYSNVLIEQHPDLQIVANNTTSMTLSVNENIIPTNDFILPDRAEVPVFNSRRLEGSIFRAGATPGRTKVIVDQAVPVYIGWFGGDPNNSNDSRYSKRLIIDSHDLPTLRQWYINTSITTSVQNKETGLDNTKALMAMSDPANYKVAYYCYMLNDRNRNGTIDADEPIDWYLASQNQLMSVWVTKEGLNTSFTSADYYWSSSEATMQNQAGTASDLSFKIGYGAFQYKTSERNSARCCRDL